MRGIYISVPDHEFSFYMSLLEKFKTVTVIKTDELKVSKSDEFKLLPWQIKELDIAIEDDDQNPKQGVDAKEFTRQLREKFSV